ncbi:hypothetical protein FRC08_007243 [Ceratobasidium sp. 394]|nr:hypothetical protein FRC08_007243 [Ceratobasidium sp. 394]
MRRPWGQFYGLHGAESWRAYEKDCTADPLQRGTTVLVEKLFAPLPVRRRELERMIKRDYARALQLMQAYVLVPCVGGSWPSSDKRAARGVRLTVSNQSGKG